MGGRVFQEEAEAAWPGWVRPGKGGAGRQVRVASGGPRELGLGSSMVWASAWLLLFGASSLARRRG